MLSFTSAYWAGSLTLILGVMFELNANPYLVDAVIGLSVVYKALENLAQQRGRRFVLDTRAAVFIFGLCHGWVGHQAAANHLTGGWAADELLAFNLGSQRASYWHCRDRSVGIYLMPTP